MAKLSQLIIYNYIALTINWLQIKLNTHYFLASVPLTCNCALYCSGDTQWPDPCSAYKKSTVQPNLILLLCLQESYKGSILILKFTDVTWFERQDAWHKRTSSFHAPWGHVSWSSSQGWYYTLWWVQRNVHGWWHWAKVRMWTAYWTAVDVLSFLSGVLCAGSCCDAECRKCLRNNATYAWCCGGSKSRAFVFHFLPGYCFPWSVPSLAMLLWWMCIAVAEQCFHPSFLCMH